jgi:hypothetical protein
LLLPQMGVTRCPDNPEVRPFVAESGNKGHHERCAEAQSSEGPPRAGRPLPQHSKRHSAQFLTCFSWLGAADDHDRAGCVERALLADRTEQQIGKAPMPAGADDEQILVANGID